MQAPAIPNAIETMKAERGGLDIGRDIPKFADGGWESIPKQDVDRLKWWGVFLRKQSEGESGYFMMRIRIPNGIATSAQLAAIARITNEQGRGIADITTRQQMQLRWIRIEDVPAVLDELRAVGLVTLQTGMDNIRNVVGCSMAGLTPNELLDASAVAREYNDIFVGNEEFTNLPRKFNVSITGCTENCVHSEGQDVSLVPALKQVGDEQMVGFNILVGGKQGSGGYTVAAPLDVFVTATDGARACAELTRIFRDFGSRQARSRARFAFLLEDRGIGTVRELLEQRMGQLLERAGEDQRGAGTTDHVGVMAQAQAGLNAVGLVVPVGRITGAQMAELARLADLYGSGELRLTPDQNVIVPNIADAMLEAFLAEPLLAELRHDPSPVMRGLVSCTGTDFCNLALIDTKKRALELARELEGEVTRPLTIHWSGCPAGCGNHASADIGLVGKRVRIGREVIDAVDIYLGGSTGPAANRGVPVLEDVPCDDLKSTLLLLLRYGAFNDLRQHMAVTPLDAERRALPDPATIAATLPAEPVAVAI